MSWYRLDPAELLLDDVAQSLDEEAFGVLMRLSLRAMAGVPIRDDEGACRRAAGTRCRDWVATWAAVRAVLVPVESIGFQSAPRASNELSWPWLEGRIGDTQRRLKTDRDRKPKGVPDPAKATRPSDSNGIHRNPPDSTLRTDGRTDEPTNERTQKRAPRAAAPPLSFPGILDAPEFRSVWETWTQYRREKKAALTPTGAKAQLAKCADMGSARAIAALQHTMVMGWTGMREPEAAAPTGTIQKGPNKGQPSARDWLLGQPAQPARETTARVVNQ